VIWLLRHCEATGQAPDAPLTDRGARQAQTIVPVLAGLGVARIVSSPYLRATASAAPFAAEAGLAITEDPCLAEWRLTSGPAENWRDLLAASFADPALAHPGGETAATALARALRALHAHEGTPTLFVTHGGIATLILSRFGGVPGLETLEALGSPGLFALEGATHQRLALPGVA